MEKEEIVEKRIIDGCQLEIYGDHEEASRAVVQEIIRISKESMEQFGNFCLNLSGGRTILRAEELLAKEYSDRIEWARVHIFWGDEHIVGANSEENNFFLAWRHLRVLVEKGLLPKENLHRIKTEEGGRLFDLGRAEKEARRYEEAIKRVLGSRKGFDLSLLGLGADCHTASLLPQRKGFKNPAFNSKRLVEAINYPDDLYPGARVRITLTPKMLRLSARTIMLVTGAKKRGALRRALAEGIEIYRKPGSIIRTLPNAKVIADKAAIEF